MISISDSTLVRLVHLNAKDSTTIQYAVTGHDTNGDERFETLYWMPTPNNGYNEIYISKGGMLIYKSCGFDKGRLARPTINDYAEAGRVVADG